MKEKTKTREITLVERGGAFTSFFKRIASDTGEYDFESLSSLRRVLHKEKIKILNIIKIKRPKSLYQLAKFLNRDFKAVSKDLSLLEKFGFIEMIAEKTGKRQRLRPVLAIDSLNLKIKI